VPIDVTGGFFNYPTEEGGATRVEELVFLPDRPDADWRILLEHTETRRFRAGDEVIRAGDTDRALLLLTEGALAVRVPGGTDDFKMITAPTVIGEVAFLDGGPRSVTLVAAEDGELQRLSMEAFEVLGARHPELARAVLLDLGRILAVRLRIATDLLGGS
jgi:CRP/FNR family transcriptional regulator, cyclic AMP receptor protein